MKLWEKAGQMEEGKFHDGLLCGFAPRAVSSSRKRSLGRAASSPVRDSVLTRVIPDAIVNHKSQRASRDPNPEIRSPRSLCLLSDALGRGDRNRGIAASG